MSEQQGLRLLPDLSAHPVGAVTVDLANRQYAGVRLPGPASDPAALRSVSSGAAALQGTLSVTGHVGVGTATPENAEALVDEFGSAARMLGAVIRNTANPTMLASGPKTALQRSLATAWRSPPTSTQTYSASGLTAAVTLAGSVHGVVVQTISASPARPLRGNRT